MAEEQKPMTIERILSSWSGKSGNKGLMHDYVVALEAELVEHVEDPETFIAELRYTVEGGTEDEVVEGGSEFTPEAT